MSLAVEVASRSNCLKSHVGAIVLLGDRIRAVGYNGTVEAYANCFDGGCPRCRDLTIRRAEQLDRCICVHAEENALMTAARYGIPVDGAECYVTHEPCVGCTKLLIQAHISRIVYLQSYDYPETGDHNESRRSMRENLKSSRFERFDTSSAGEGVVSRWIDRLHRMKSDAFEYAKSIGILKAS